MAAPTLAEAGRVIVKKAPTGLSNRMYYFARRSNPVGITPDQLKGNAEKMKQVAPKCSAVVRGMPAGADKIRKFRGCVAENM